MNRFWPLIQDIANKIGSPLVEVSRLSRQKRSVVTPPDEPLTASADHSWEREGGLLLSLPVKLVRLDRLLRHFPQERGSCTFPPRSSCIALLVYLVTLIVRLAFFERHLPPANPADNFYTFGHRKPLCGILKFFAVKALLKREIHY